LIAYEAIANHQAVIEAFGQWPSFHDGEVLRVLLDRTRRHPNGSYIASIELVVRGWVMTSEVTESGCFKLEHDSVVHFLFEQVEDVVLEDLNHQNVLSSLNLKIVSDHEFGVPLLSVELGQCFGLCGSFKSRRASVVSVVPYACETGP
jgi:hypothetical protein